MQGRRLPSWNWGGLHVHANKLGADPSADVANASDTRAILLNGVFYDAAELRAD
jgi:hypothetical protein